MIFVGGLYTVFGGFRMSSEVRESWWSEFLDVVGCELALFKKVPFLGVAAFILVLVPSFYTATYVCSVWDPYESMKKLPVGFVMLDEGVDFHDEHYNLGADLFKKLKEDEVFRFRDYASEAEAIAAVRSGAVYFSLVVPADFSAKTLPGIEIGKFRLYTSSGRSFVGCMCS